MSIQHCVVIILTVIGVDSIIIINGVVTIIAVDVPDGVNLIIAIMEQIHQCQSIGINGDVKLIF